MIDKSDLIIFIEEIDKFFDSEQIPIHHRTMKCLSEVSKQYNIKLPLSSSCDKKSLNDSYKITYIVQEWYEKRYGDRLRFNFDIGFSLLLLRGQLLTCRVPNFFGTCNFFIDRDFSSKVKGNETNILKMIKGITQDFSDSLSEKEEQYIFSSFQKGLNAAIIISDWSLCNLEMIKAAMNDLEGIKQNVSLNQPHTANCKWAYNQFLEKTLKSWIIKAGVSRQELKKKGHKLEDLFDVFNVCYQANLDKSKVSLIMGSPSLRYDEIQVTNEELITIQDCVHEIVIQIGSSPKLV